MTLDDVSINATAGTPGVDADSASLGAIPDASGCGGLQTAGDPLNVSFQVGGKVGLPDGCRRADGLRPAAQLRR